MRVKAPECLRPGPIGLPLPTPPQRLRKPPRAQSRGAGGNGGSVPSHVPNGLGPPALLRMGRGRG
jgi:hypothetical protein